jgi:hypothetical protein
MSKRGLGVWTADKQPVALLAKKTDWIVQVIPQQATKAIPVLSTRKIVARRQELGWYFLLLTTALGVVRSLRRPAAQQGADAAAAQGRKHAPLPIQASPPCHHLSTSLLPSHMYTGTPHYHMFSSSCSSAAFGVHQLPHMSSSSCSSAAFGGKCAPLAGAM